MSLPDGDHEVEGRVASKDGNSIGVLEVFASGAAGTAGTALLITVPESRLFVLGAIALYTPIRVYYSRRAGANTYITHEDPK
jgi:hypothetical protein